jgi:hypothetical protein
MGSLFAIPRVSCINGLGNGLRMVRRLAVIAVLAAVGLSLAGCGPCGFDWPWATSCRGGPPAK